MQAIFDLFLQIVKQKTIKSCKIGYNWIFITKYFLEMDEKRCLKMVQYGLSEDAIFWGFKCLFSLWNILRSTEN